MPRQANEHISLDSLTEKTTETRNSAPTVDYLYLAQLGDTVSKGIIDIKKVAKVINERLDKKALRLPILDSRDNKELAERLTEDLKGLNGNVIEGQYIIQLLEDTDPTHLLPPEHERNKPSGQMDDWTQEIVTNNV